MHCFPDSRPEMPRRLVAAFDSEQQLTSYVRWATVCEHDVAHKSEKGSLLAGYQGYSHASETLTNDDAATVDHNPSPSMR
jgi:hypothetical protein